MNNPRQQNYRTKLCLLAALFISPTALADEALSRRERTATQKTIETTILAQYHGNYQVVRDQQYHGEHGLVKALDAWMADTYAWMG